MLGVLLEVAEGVLQMSKQPPHLVLPRSRLYVSTYRVSTSCNARFNHARLLDTYYALFTVAMGGVVYGAASMIAVCLLALFSPRLCSTSLQGKKTE